VTWRSDSSSAALWLFSAVAEMFQPKTFSGLFGAAPSVAIATLTLTYTSDGAETTAIAARWMAIGSLALFAYASLWARACARHVLLDQASRVDMTAPKIDLSGLRKPAAWEYLVRFVFGGLVTAGAFLISKRFGAAFGGLFLAFPALMPASLTLVKRHDGRACATDDARGGRIGALALTAFAIVVTVTAASWPLPMFLLVATLTWAAVATGLWVVLLRVR